MPKTNAEKLKEKVAEKFGDRSVMMASQMPRYPKISTGSLALDFATGVGGWPSDRYVEVFGAESCGKTTLGLLGMKNFLDAQPKRGAIIIDTEHKMDIDWATVLVGADYMAKRIIYLQPDSIEDATEMYKECVSDGSTCYVLFDSIASSQTRKSVTTDKDEMTGNAKAMARFAPIMAAFSAKYQCCTYAVNQTREDIEGYHRILTPGGRAPKHAAALRVYLKKAKGEVFETINGEKLRIGHTVAAKIIKNQLGGIEGRTCSYWFFNVFTEQWGFGVDQVEEISRLAAITGSIERKGAWYYHPQLPDGKICGADQFAAQVKANEVLRTELTTAIMTRIKEHGNEVAPVSDPEDLDDMPVGELFRRGPFSEDLTPFPDDPRQMSSAQLDHVAQGLLENFQKEG